MFGRETEELDLQVSLKLIEDIAVERLAPEQRCTRELLICIKW
jgi:hypothetical protein